jgi:hypothetical protein
MRITVVFLLVFLFGAVLAASREDLVRDFDNSRSSWVKHGPPNYQFTITKSCVCTPSARLGPIQITVKQGKTVRSVYVGPTAKGYRYGQNVLPEKDLMSVSELFKDIEWAIATHPSKSASFSVHYDTSDGHPARYRYDDLGGDDSFTIVLSDFRRL